MFSRIVRRNCPLIARPPHFDCAPLQLGVRESATVLKLIERVRSRGVAVLFITHNAYHAYASGDRFMVLRRGEAIADFAKNERTIGEVIELMAGGAELNTLLTSGEARPHDG